jgi:hypothetical protein
MKIRNAIKKVKSHFKKQGIDIDISYPTRSGNHRFTFQHDGQVGSFFANGHDGHSEGWEDAEGTNWHIRGINDVSDIRSDYHAGSFRDNITQICESLLPSPPKFPAGSLVRGKENKRAQRWGFSGAVGLVVEVQGGDYIKVRWCGDSRASRPMIAAETTCSFRDLEVAA